MSDTLISVLALLAVILVVSLVIVIRRGDIKQRIKFPFGSWEVETGNRRSSSSRGKESKSIASDPSQMSEVDFGQRNLYKGPVGDVAGQDIIDTNDMAYNQGPSQSSHVRLGMDNVFMSGTGDIAGRNIIRNPKSTDLRSSSHQDPEAEKS